MLFHIASIYFFWYYFCRFRVDVFPPRITTLAGIKGSVTHLKSWYFYIIHLFCFSFIHFFFLDFLLPIFFSSFSFFLFLLPFLPFPSIILSSLPKFLQANTKKQKYQRILERKQATHPEQLCRGFPSEFKDFFTHCLSLGFEDRPDYRWGKKKWKMTKELRKMSGRKLNCFLWFICLCTLHFILSTLFPLLWFFFDPLLVYNNICIDSSYTFFCFNFNVYFHSFSIVYFIPADT